MILRSSLQPELDCELIAFHGELDALAAPDLRLRIDEVLTAPHGALLIDLACCTFIDSLGVAALVEGAKVMLERDRAVAIATAKPQTRRILELTGVDSLLPVCWTRDEAIARLGDEQAGDD